MSLDFAKVFNFLQGDTLMHRFDPRVKGVLLIAYSAVAFMFQDLSLFLLLFFLTLPLLICAQMTREFLKGVGGLTFLFVFILLMNTAFFWLS